MGMCSDSLKGTGQSWELETVVYEGQSDLLLSEKEVWKCVLESLCWFVDMMSLFTIYRL